MEEKTIHRGEALADFIEPRAYGEIIRYQEIERVLAEKRGTSRYYNAISKAKKLLEVRGKMIVRIGGGDYQVAYPGDYVRGYAYEVKRARNRLKHGKRILECAPVKDMTEQEHMIYNRVYDFDARISAQFAGSVTEVKRLCSPKHPFSAAQDGGSK